VTEFRWLDELTTRDPTDRLFIGADRSWNAGEVRAEMLALGERLNGCRVVGVLADNGSAWAIADLACQTAGAVHLPLPGFFSAGQLRHALEQTGADTILTDQPERIGELDLDFGITGHWQGLSWMRRVCDPVDLPPATAKISFTSGSTGSPKGVCLAAKGLLDTAQAVCERLADLPLASHFAALPLALLLENVAGVYAPLLRRLPVHLPSLASVGWQGMAGFDAELFDGAVRAARAGSLILVPELLKAWTGFLMQTGLRAPPCLRFVAVGGARVSPELIRSARRAGIPAYQGYGLTEAGSVLTLNRPGDDGEGVGRPLSHARLAVEGGELLVSTRAFLGYVGAEIHSEGCFATGDLGGFDARGHLHLQGRRGNLLITSYGRNISPEWIEAELLADARILQAIVVGEGQSGLSAIIVPRPGIGPTAMHGAVARVNAALPEYAQIVHYVLSEPFTAGNGMATGNGRPRRRRIIHRHAAAFDAYYRHEVLHDAVL
jgi:long-subunit acyl-CoA synthetase (AMP-forming)